MTGACGGICSCVEAALCKVVCPVASETCGFWEPCCSQEAL